MNSKDDIIKEATNLLHEAYQLMGIMSIDPDILTEENQHNDVIWMDNLVEFFHKYDKELCDICCLEDTEKE